MTISDIGEIAVYVIGTVLIASIGFGLVIMLIVLGIHSH